MKDIRKIKTEQELNDILDNAGKKVVLLKFSANWCGPCRVYGQNLENLSEKIWDKLIVAEVDVDEATDMSLKYNIRNIPNSLFFIDKNLKENNVGLLTIHEIEETVERIYGEQWK